MERNEGARLAYKEEIARIPKESIVYVDETGIGECLRREYCRARRGEYV